VREKIELPMQYIAMDFLEMLGKVASKFITIQVINLLSKFK